MEMNSIEYFCCYVFLVSYDMVKDFLILGWVIYVIIFFGWVLDVYLLSVG